MDGGGHSQGVAHGWMWRITNYADQRDTGRALSWVHCSVEGRYGASVSLSSKDGCTNLKAVVGSSPHYGPFFCELGPVRAGLYVLKVEGLDVALDLWLDGSANASVIFTPRPESPDR